MVIENKIKFTFFIFLVFGLPIFGGIFWLFKTGKVNAKFFSKEGIDEAYFISTSGSWFAKAEISAAQNQSDQLITKVLSEQKEKIITDTVSSLDKIDSSKTEISPKEKPKEKKDTIKNEAENPDTTNFSFVAISDSESFDPPYYNKELPGVLEKAAAGKPSFALFTGDIIVMGEGGTERAKNLKNLIDKYFKKFYFSFGNHDLECGKPCAIMWLESFFGKKNDVKEDLRLYHAFDYGNTHFALLSTGYNEEENIDETQLTWLEEDLKKTDKPNKIIAVHIPPINFFKESAKKCHDLSCKPQLQARLMSIFKKYNVDLVLSGHEAAFDHKVENGIDFVLTGNVGNKERYEKVLKGDIYTRIFINNNSINLQAIRVDKNGKEKILREIKVK